jgi:small subunit ribosomal protein S8
MSAVTDPIADMLTRIRNGIRAQHQRVDMPSSRMKVEIARILKEEGFISNYKLGEEGKKKVLKIFLRYNPDGVSVITTIERVSRPGRRLYVGAHEIPNVMGGMGVNILTTPSGIMTGKNARKAHLGGEVLVAIQ